MNPQYLFWVFSLVPILVMDKDKGERSNFHFIFLTALMIALLTQYVYPILYTDLINSFKEFSQVFTPVIYLLFLRNFIVLVLLIFSIRAFLFEKSPK